MIYYVILSIKKTEHHVMIRLQFGKKDQLVNNFDYQYLGILERILGTFERGAEQVVVCSG